MTPTGVENYTLDGLANGAAGDTLDYTGTTTAVTVNLATPSATGFASIAGIENVIGGRASTRSPATTGTTASMAAPAPTQWPAASATTPTSSTTPATRSRKLLQRGHRHGAVVAR